MQSIPNVPADLTDASVKWFDYFRQPPLRSFRFVMSTLLMVLVFTVGLLVLTRHWNELSTMTVMFIGVATFNLVTLWLGVYVIFQRLYKLYARTEPNSSSVHSALENAFRSAGAVIQLTLICTFLAANFFFLAIGNILSHH
jgi:hypothetical protein